ncbi:spheroidene monooxygenase [Panacibacter ginsenosidivorans]|nr:spheroidene monooxygenase [Panacibacter ginsenosidivorans]
MGWCGLLSMALFRLPLFFNEQINFWKLLGCGKNGTFDIYPDWRQWAILVVKRESSNVNKDNKLLYGSFINAWWNFFRCEVYTIILEPIEGHGTWDGKEAFGKLPRQTDHEGMVAVLTRATIRLNRLRHFWKHVDAVATQMNNADGFITSVGIGEVPWIKQATFSIWESKEHMKMFAYKMKDHAEVVRKTRQENWYSEDMFVRFKPILSFGNLHGIDPLKLKLQ